MTPGRPDRFKRNCEYVVSPGHVDVDSGGHSGCKFGSGFKDLDAAHEVANVFAISAWCRGELADAHDFTVEFKIGKGL